MDSKINKLIKLLVDEKRYDEIPLVLSEASKNFWSEEYPKKTFDQKVSYWSGSLHRQMRWNVESGFDEMAVFSKSDYECWKEKEPLIDTILVQVIKILNLNAEEVYEELKK